MTAPMTAPVQDAAAAGVPQEPCPDPALAPRFTWGLIIDVFDVLERYGYRRADDQHTGQAVGLLFRLTRVYQGTEETI